MDVVDIGLFDKVQLSREVELNKKTMVRETANEFAYQILPEELMEELERYTGDGNASITVGSDLAKSDFGNKAGAFVSVTVKCHAGGPEIQATHDILRPWIEQQVKDNQTRMQDILDELRGHEPQPALGPASSVPPKASRPSFAR